MSYQTEMPKYRQEILGEFRGPSRDEQRALALYARYSIECDQFDDTFLTGRRHGESYPANYLEHRQMVTFSRDCWEKTMKEAKFWGLRGSDLRAARESVVKLNREQQEELYERFKNTLDPERESRR